MATSAERSDADQKVEFIRQFFQERDNQVVIVTAGKSGVGKSTLINTFLELEGAEASESNMQPTSVTDSIAYYDNIVNGAKLRVIDIPGLHAYDHNRDIAEAILHELSRLTRGKVDVLFYCVNITNRLDRTDWDNIDTVTRMFGTDVWKHAVFVFTWSDIAVYNGQNLKELAEKFANSIQQGLKERRINTTIRSVYSFDTDMLSNDAEINSYDGIVAIPVGKDPASPPEWRTALLLQVIRKCRKESIPAFLQLVYKIDWEEIRKSALTIASHGFVGAGVGALIGGVLNGIYSDPSEGVEAVFEAVAEGVERGCTYGLIVAGSGATIFTALDRISAIIDSRYRHENARHENNTGEESEGNNTLP